MLHFLKRLFGGRGEEAPSGEASLRVARAGQERAEAGLRQSEEHFAQLVAGVRDYAVFLLDRQGNVLTWNAGAERIKGYRAEDIIGQHFSRFYPKDVVMSGWPAHELSEASATGRFEDEGWRVRKDGSRFWAKVVITALRDPAGEVRGFLKITRDLTDRKQAEEKLRLSEERFRLLVESVKDYAIFMLDPQGRVATWNQGAQHIKGYTADEIIGQHFSRFYPPEVVERGWPDEELRRATAEGRFENEGWRVRKDGSRFWANVVITAVRDESGVLRGFAKVTRDLTERRQAEENARRLLQEEAARKAAEESAQVIERQREQLHVTLASIGDAVIVTDQNGIVTFMNAVAASLTGWDEAAGQPLDQVFRIVNENTRRTVENPALRALREGILVGLANHTVLIARDGRERPIDDCAAPIRVGQERVVGAVLVFRDISKRRQAEAALREENRRKTEFLALLAHELRNPLAPLRNGLQIMHLASDRPEAVEQARAMMERQLHHLGRLVDDLLDISRISRGKIELRKERINLAEVVSNAVEACQPLVQQQDDELTVSLPDEKVYVDADKTRLAQALSNLLSNAVKYSNRGSRIWLTVTREPGEPGASATGDEAVLRVKDTGVGIPAAMLPRVFDMFTQVDRSLEKSQGGLGVGLSIVKQLIEMHGGSVEARSEAE